MADDWNRGRQTAGGGALALRRDGGKECADFLQHLGDRVCREGADSLSLARAPVEALDLVGQDDSADGKPGRYSYLEGISLCSAGDRAGEQQADAAIVIRG